MPATPDDQRRLDPEAQHELVREGKRGRAPDHGRGQEGKPDLEWRVPQHLLEVERGEEERREHAAGHEDPDRVRRGHVAEPEQRERHERLIAARLDREEEHESATAAASSPTV